MPKSPMTDSELARAIASSPYHQMLLAHEDSSIARYGVEFEQLAGECKELFRELDEKLQEPEPEEHDDEGPTALYHRVNGQDWYRKN